METREVELLKKKKSRRRVENSKEYWSVKDLAIGNKVIIAFTIIFRM
jgi:hypothetical protein